MIIDALPFTPYVLGYHTISGSMLDRIPADLHPRFFDIFDPASLSLYRLVNAGNSAAYNDMGMPLWVQLDCCTLPSAMFGFALPREHVPDDLWTRLLTSARRIFGDAVADGLADYDGLVPISEYCGVRAHDPDVTLGFSMYALLPASRLGVRTKALALLGYGTQRQIGTTQWSNTSIRAHCRFGPLHIVEPRALTHSRPDVSFVYAIDIPEPAALLELVRTGDSDRILQPEPTRIIEAACAADASDQIAQLLRNYGPHSLVAPGLLSTEPLRLQLAPR